MDGYTILNCQQKCIADAYYVIKTCLSAKTDMHAARIKRKKLQLKSSDLRQDGYAALFPLS